MSTGGLDLAYVRERPDTLERLIEHQRIRETPIPGGDTCSAQRLTLDDGTDLFTKTMTDAPAGFFEAEATGLRWLAEAGAVPVPEVIAVSPSRLVLTWVQPGPAASASMAELGRGLAASARQRVHRRSVRRGRGSSAALPLDNTPGASWPEFYAERRVRPYLRLAVDAGPDRPGRRPSGRAGARPDRGAGRAAGATGPASW